MVQGLVVDYDVAYDDVYTLYVKRIVFNDP
jgi:hypothetical protein